MRFKAYASPKDASRVLGYVEPYGVMHGDQCTWLQTPFGALSPSASHFDRT